MTTPGGQRLRVGVIGYGGWGRVHLAAYRDDPRTEVVALCGRDPERAAAAAARYGGRPYTDVDRMLEEARPDLVSVVLPDEGHLGPTLQVLEAGVACFAEKPLAMDRGEALRLLEAARRSGARFGINFNHRYSTPFQKARAVIAAGTLGAPAYLLWKFTGGHYPERHGPLGHLLYMQSHGFDMLRWLGGPIAEVSCVTSSPRGAGTLTSAVVSLRFVSGAVGALIASVDANYADTHNHEFEYVGLGGRIRVSDALRCYELSLRQREPAVEMWCPGFFGDEDRSFAATTARHIAAFVDAQLQGGPVPVPADDGYAALQAGLAAIEAAGTGGRVAVLPLVAPAQGG